MTAGINLADVENDTYDRQDFAYRMLKYLNKTEEDVAQIKLILQEQWIGHYTNLLLVRCKQPMKTVQMMLK